MPKIALIPLHTRNDSLKDTVDFAIQHGFKAIELHGKHQSSDLLSEEEIQFLIEVSKTSSIEFNLHFHHDALPASHRASVRRETMDRFIRDLDLLHRIGGAVIVLHPGMIDVPTLTSADNASELVRREALRNVSSFLRQAAPEAARRGVLICVENQTHLPGRVVQSYQELAILVDDADHDNVAVTLDVGHCIIGDGLTKAMGIFGDRIRHLHLNDAVDGFEHKEIGIGNLDFKEMQPLMSEQFNIQFATMEVGIDRIDARDVMLRSRQALMAHYGDAIE